MRTAVDTNIFSSLLSGDEVAVATMQTALENASAEGTLVVSPTVYAELVAGRTTEAVDGFFLDKSVEVDWEMGRELWRAAGSRYGAYARDRRRRRGDTAPRRILADFLIGAHALHLARALLTADARIYSTYFPELKIIAPPGSPADTGE